MSERGVITVASGHRRYLEMAVDMALSGLENSPKVPVSLALSEDLKHYLSEDRRRVFDQVIDIPPGIKPKIFSKFYLGEATPYKYSLFLDSDCMINKDLSPLFDWEDKTSMRIPGEYLELGDDRMHNCYNTDRIMSLLNLKRYLKTNSSVLYFEKREGERVMKSCRDLIGTFPWGEADFMGKFYNCEVLIGSVGDKEGIKTFDNIQPMPWLIDGLIPGDDSSFFYHVIGRPQPEFTDWLLANVYRRRQDRGLEPGASIRFWMKKLFNNSKYRFLRTQGYRIAQRNKPWMQRAG